MAELFSLLPKQRRTAHIAIAGLLTGVMAAVYSINSTLLLLVALAVIQITPFFWNLYNQRFSFLGIVFLYHFFAISFHRFYFFLEGGLSAALPKAVVAEVTTYLAITASSYLVYYGVCKLLRFDGRTTSTITGARPSPLVYLLTVAFIFSSLLTPPAAFKIIFLTLQLFALAFLFLSESPLPRFTDFLVKSLVVVVGVFFFVQFKSLSFFVTLSFVWLISILLNPSSERLSRLAIVLVMMGLFQSVKGEFRAQSHALSFSRSASVLSRLLTDHYLPKKMITAVAPNVNRSPASTTAVGRYSKAFLRIGDNSLELTLAKSPLQVPYWNGASYKDLFYVFIPRAIWADKPERKVWNKFGKDYGVLAADDHITSVAFNPHAEGYMNFGYVGLWLASLGYILLVVFLDLALYRVSPQWYAVLFTILLIPFVTAQDTTSLISSLLYTSALAVVIAKALQYRRQRSAAGRAIFPKPF